MHRFFVEPSALAGDRAILSGSLAHQLLHVLRLRPGARILLLDGAGWEYEAELISLEKRGGEVRLLAQRAATGEPRTQVTLYQAVLRGPRFEWVLQKGTELGIAAFIPILTARGVAIPKESETKLARWEAIVREAAEQAGRGRLPSVTMPVAFADACANVKTEKALIAWEEERTTGLRAALTESGSGGTSWALFVGPEGGFTAEEVALARSCNVRPIRLGSRTLRAETAGIAAVAALFFALGEWD
ncbi:MAG: 16S rRNA (uracil(1498)-N(3))-methyltransferase [Anaerolineae bacterium]|nr:16S rRNA (uracil(1498)-N(3))-methyltransferase [Anaerolineae bacterium]